jgi:hypothetical protein
MVSRTRVNITLYVVTCLVYLHVAQCLEGWLYVDQFMIECGEPF